MSLSFSTMIVDGSYLPSLLLKVLTVSDGLDLLGHTFADMRASAFQFHDVTGSLTTC